VLAIWFNADSNPLRRVGGPRPVDLAQHQPVGALLSADDLGDQLLRMPRSSPRGRRADRKCRGLMRMISPVVMAVLGRVYNDGCPAMGLVLIGMHGIRFGVVIRSATGIGTRCNGKRRANTKYRE
jgi:hypothetical protein